MKGLYGIADAGFGDPVELGALLLQASPCALQVRAKGWEAEAVAEVLRRLHPLCAQAGVPLIINDFAALAGLCDGLHLGQDDGPFPRGCGLRGRSTHSLDDLARALAEGVDYVGFGPVFPTSTHPTPKPTQGLAALARICDRSVVPVVAIGGISRARIAGVYAAGASAWAVISDIFTADDPLLAAQTLSSNPG